MRDKPSRISQIEEEVKAMLPAALEESGVSTNLSQTAIEEAARAAAHSQIVEAYGELLLPMEAARKTIEAAMEKAKAAYKESEEASILALREMADVAHAEARKLAAEEAALKVGRTSRWSGKKLASAIAKETNTNRIAYDELEKPEDEQDPILAEMGRLLLQINSKRPPEVKTRQQIRDRAQQKIVLKLRVQSLKEQRLARAIAEEAAEAAAEKAHSEAKIIEEHMLEQAVQDWLATGQIGEAEAESLTLDQEEAKRRHTKIEREKKTTPVLHQTMKDHPRPGVEKPGVEGERQFLRDLHEWAKTWTVAARDALHEAGVEVSKKLSWRFNTAEENALIYAEHMLDKVEWVGKAEAQGRMYPKAADLTRGQSLIEAWEAVSFAEPKPTEGMSAEAVKLQKFRDAEALRGLTTDASQTEFSRKDPWGANAIEALNAETLTARYKRGVSPGAMLHTDTAMEEALRSAMAEKGFSSEEGESLFSPETVEAGADHEAETMTAAEAIDKHLGGGKLTGWRRLVRRALVRSLKALIGDMQVRFVDGSEIAKRMADGRAAAGMFRYVRNGQSYILIDKNAKGRPGLLAETLVHEMVHAATAHAIDNNIRGTRDAIKHLMTALKRQLNTVEGAAKYAFGSEHEFLTMGMQDGSLQEAMRSLNVPLNVRAQLRALSHGRETATFWDTFVSLVQHAIGAVIPGQAGASYMDQLLSVYPQAAMSSSQQMADKAIRLRQKDTGDLNLASPFGLGELMNSASALTLNTMDNVNRWQRGINKFISTNRLVRRATDTVFGGDFDNSYNDLAKEIATLARQIEDGMREGDQMDDGLLRWMMEDEFNRRHWIAEAHDLSTNATADGIDMRKTLQENYWIRDDAFHPPKGKRRRKLPTFKHVRDTGKRAAHARYHERWNKLPAELRTLLSARLDHMKQQMVDYQHDNVQGIVDRIFDKPNYFLPPGMSRPTLSRRSWTTTCPTS